MLILQAVLFTNRIGGIQAWPPSELPSAGLCFLLTFTVVSMHIIFGKKALFSRKASLSFSLFNQESTIPIAAPQHFSSCNHPQDRLKPVCAHMFMCVQMCIRVYAHVCVSPCVCVCAWVDISVTVCMHVYTDVYVCMCTCMCVHAC